MRATALLSFALTAFLILPYALAWEPPIGIPRPDFGIEESYLMYNDAVNRINPNLAYSPNTAGGYYTHYVDSTAIGGCDDGSDGTIESPRCEIPLNLEAGSIVEIHGGPYGSNSITVAGTSSQPIFFRGVNQDDRPMFTDRIIVNGFYTILENLEFSGAGPAVSIPALSQNISVRNSEMYGGPVKNSAGVSVSGKDIVVYNNLIYDNGEWQGLTENDFHGVGVGSPAERVWIVDNEMYHNGGDGVQISSGPEPNPYASYVYIGRNLMYENRENAVDVKESADIIISQNEIYGFSPSQGQATSSGEAITSHHDDRDPMRVWILYNEIYNSSTGITAPTTHTFKTVGNIIYGCGTAISSGSSTDVSHLGNTVYASETGIVADPRGSEISEIYNNLVAELTGSYTHIRASSAVERYGVEVYNNLFYQSNGPININYDGSRSLEELNQRTDSGGNIEGRPLFEDLAAGNVRLGTGSPAIGTAILSDVYAEFETAYGLDIRLDFDQNPRPQGPGWDIGAFESEADTCIDTADLLGYISQWRQGSISMPTMMETLGKWKSGEGC